VDLELAGRRAIITGASRGIGRTIAETLAAEGVDLVISARTPGPLEESAAAIAAAHGTTVHPVVGDTRSSESMTHLVEEAVVLLGGIDILVNNAATPGGSSPVREASAVPVDAVAADFDAKALGYLRASQAVAPHLVAQGWGRIINIGGHTGNKTGFLSGTLRNAAVSALGKTLADELGPSGVTVTTIHPAGTRTERTNDLYGSSDRATVEARAAAESSNARMTDATEVAWVVAFLASPKSVAINGEAIFVGGGFRGRISY
jgi:NAD(P)-dependent dehydrogenase (short-subunit alcohol dehydrogenase family)